MLVILDPNIVYLCTYCDGIYTTVNIYGVKQ